MASIDRVKDFAADTPPIDRQDIADLLEDALLTDVGLSDLAADVILVRSQSEAPDPSAGLWWHDLTDNLWKVYDSSHSIWLAIGPDRRDVPMQNWSGGILGKGAAVTTIVDEGNEHRFTVRGGNGWESWHWMGCLQETTDSGLWGPVAIQGVMWAWATNTPDGGSVDAGRYQRHAAAADTGELERVDEPADGNPASGAFGVAAQDAGAGEVFKMLWIGPTQASNTS